MNTQNRIKSAIRGQWLSLFMDGRNEHGTHLLRVPPDGLCLGENEYEATLDSRNDSAERIFKAAEGLGYIEGCCLVVVCTAHRDEHACYYELSHIDVDLTDLMHGTALEQIASLSGAKKKTMPSILTYTISEDGLTARMGPCRYPGYRLSIIRLCKLHGFDFPPETLDEDVLFETLRDALSGLLVRRDNLYKAEQRGRAAKRRLETAVREGRLSPATAAKAADLRARASSLRQGAHYAERMESARGELEEAARLEAEADRLIKEEAK